MNSAHAYLTVLIIGTIGSTAIADSSCLATRLRLDIPAQTSLPKTITNAERLLNAENGLRTDPRNVQLLVAKSQALLNTRRPVESLNNAKYALSIDPTSEEAKRLVTQSLTDLSRLDDAHASALQLKPDAFQKFFISRILIAEGKNREAITLLKKLKVTPSVSWELAHAYYNVGDFQSARSSLIQMVQSTKEVKPKVVAALIKIDLQGDKPGRDPMIELIKKSLDPKVLKRIVAEQDRIRWSHEIETGVDDVSISNTFWTRDHSLPIDGKARKEIGL